MHEIRVSSLLTPEEYLAFKVVTEASGASASARIRFLIKRDIQAFVHSESIGAIAEKAMPEPVQEEGM